MIERNITLQGVPDGHRACNTAGKQGAKGCYDPVRGDDYRQISPGTPFSRLPDHRICPECDAGKSGFMVIEN
jgi:rubredoxin